MEWYALVSSVYSLAATAEGSSTVISIRGYHDGCEEKSGPAANPTPVGGISRGSGVAVVPESGMVHGDGSGGVGAVGISRASAGCS